jgi:hypothetical protein
VGIAVDREDKDVHLYPSVAIADDSLPSRVPTSEKLPVSVVGSVGYEGDRRPEACA